MVLINGTTSPFFKAERGLRQGCSLSSLIFLLVVEGLIQYLIEVVRRGDLQGLKLAPGITLTHLLFVDDIILFCNGSRRDIEFLERGINIFKTTRWMLINLQKSTLSPFLLRKLEVRNLINFFSDPVSDLLEGIKYLGFYLKPNDYRKSH